MTNEVEVANRYSKTHALVRHRLEIILLKNLCDEVYLGQWVLYRSYKGLVKSVSGYNCVDRFSLYGGEPYVTIELSPYYAPWKGWRRTHSSETTTGFTFYLNTNLETAAEIKVLPEGEAFMCALASLGV